MTRLFIWDSPNMDRSLGDIIGRIPISAERPNMKALMRWFQAENPGEDNLACVFVNVEINPNSNPKFHGWLRMLSGSGYAIFAKPKISEDSDIDDDMVAYIEKYRETLTEVVIGSHDANCFKTVAPELIAAGVKVSIIGFSELANGWDAQRYSFRDIESIENVFDPSLPRHINIFQLPPEGMMFDPTGSNTSTQTRRRSAKRVNPAATQRHLAKMAELTDAKTSTESPVVEPVPNPLDDPPDPSSA